MNYFFEAFLSKRNQASGVVSFLTKCQGSAKLSKNIPFLLAVTAAAALVHTHREPKGGPGKGEQRTVLPTQNIMVHGSGFDPGVFRNA